MTDEQAKLVDSIERYLASRGGAFRWDESRTATLVEIIRDQQKALASAGASA